MALIKNTSRALQRQVDLTTAVCQERLLATHVRHVIAFVALVVVFPLIKRALRRKTPATDTDTTPETVQREDSLR